jgi:ferredoxin-NADP reductase
MLQPPGRFYLPSVAFLTTLNTHTEFQLMETRSLEKKAVSTTTDNPGAIQTVELLQRRWLTKNAFEIELTRPPSLAFKPGQAIRLIHETIESYYSLISAPDDTTLVLCVYNVPHGSFSPRLADAEIGATFHLTGPHGYFTFNPSERTPVFAASGTGIAPFVSMGRSGVTDFILLHEVELAEDFYYQDLFRNIASNYSPCLLGPAAADPSLSDTFHGNAADYIKKKLPPASYDFYLCGNREMTSQVTLLVDEQFPDSHVFREVFF